MTIFHSFAKLPEGRDSHFYPFKGSGIISRSTSVHRSVHSDLPFLRMWILQESIFRVKQSKVLSLAAHRFVEVEFRTRMKPTGSLVQHISATELRLDWCMHPGPKFVPLGGDTWDTVMGRNWSVQTMIPSEPKWLWIMTNDIIFFMGSLGFRTLASENGLKRYPIYILYNDFSILYGLWLRQWLLWDAVAWQESTSSMTQQLQAQSQLQAQRVLGTRDKSKGAGFNVTTPEGR